MRADRVPNIKLDIIENRLRDRNDASEFFNVQINVRPVYLRGLLDPGIRWGNPIGNGKGGNNGDSNLRRGYVDPAKDLQGYRFLRRNVPNIARHFLRDRGRSVGPRNDVVIRHGMFLLPRAPGVFGRI